MADVETGVKITSKGNALQGIKRDMDAAFNPRSVKEFTKTAKELEAELSRVNREQSKIALQLREVDKGSDAYVKLRDRMADVKEEAALVNTALSNLRREHNEFARQMDQADRKAATPAGPGMGRSFVAGMAQGVGVAQYIPADRGMAGRMGGAMVGGMLRGGLNRGIGAATTPGVGGLAGLLNAVPWIGPALAGGVQQGASLVQERMGFDAQRLQNLPYAVGSVEGLQRAAQLAGQSRSTKVPTAKVATPAGHAANPLAPPPGLGLTPVEAALWQGMMETRREKSIAHTLATGETGMTGDWEIDSYRRHKNQSYLQKYGMAKADESKQIQAAMDKKSALKTQAGAMTGASLNWTPGAGFGADLGFGASQVQSAWGSFMGARGGSGGVGPRGFREALSIQRLFGIDTGTQGQYARQFMPGAGGKSGAGSSLNFTLGTAIMQGLQGAQIGEYLQGILTHTKAMEQEGIKFSVKNLTGTAAMMNAVGLQGLQAQRVSGGLQQSARSLSAGGVQNPIQVLMARAAGWTPEGGAESYAGAMNKLAGGMTPQMMEKFLGMIMQGTSSWGKQMRTLLVRRALRQAGAAIGPDQAEMFIDSFQDGRLTDEAREELAGSMGAAGEIAKKGFSGAASAGTGARGGLTTTGTAMEAERLKSANRKMARVVQAWQTSSIAMANAMTPLAEQFKELAGLSKSFAAIMEKGITKLADVLND